MTLQDPKNALPTLIFEDNDLLVVNKPAGLLSVEDGYDPSLPHLRTMLEPTYGDLWMVHRLDKDSSGIILLARSAEAHRILNRVFREREIKKIYHGLVTPAPSWREMDIQLPLRPDADRKHRTRVDAKTGKPARSRCKVIKVWKHGGLMEIEILTGITHQIRAHLRAHNLALLGDILYNAGLPDQPFDVPRMMLHARHLCFNHPILGNCLNFSAPYPDDFRHAYQSLATTTIPGIEI